MKSGLSLYAIATLAVSAVPRAQAQGGMVMGSPDHAAHEAMAGKMIEGDHMRMTPVRERTTADSVRAMTIADTLRAALAKYANPAAAERDGFRLFAPRMKNQKIYHYTKWSNALEEVFRFDPRKPTSILYKKDSTGQLRITGAMYTMPKRASPVALDKRIPLSVTQWHLHTNLCAPKKGQEQRYYELQNGKPLFGLAGTITTKGACDAENGRFYPVIFGWMVHANVFEGTDLKSVWGHDDQREHAEHRP
jgi:hypothetical protein